MKRLISLFIVLLALSIFTGFILAQEVQNNGAKKSVKAQNVDGFGNPGANWVDANGDGICDNFGTNNQRSKLRNGNRNGKMGKGQGRFGNGSRICPQDGRGRFGNGSGIRPQDGRGLGNGAGTGVCDGTGPKGNNSRSGGK